MQEENLREEFSNPLKRVSMLSLEKAIAEAISSLVGEELDCYIQSFDFEAGGFGDGTTMTVKTSRTLNSFTLKK